ncbi:MAG: thymidine kinase [Bosea sp. (in: a-proteobacteria)]
MIATLTVVAGPMFAGKTSALINRILAALDDHQMPVVIVKPTMDTRFGEAAIVTHDGVAHPALPISCEHDLFAAVAEASARVQGPVHVFVDEMQFLEAPHFHGSFHEAVHVLLVAGHNVTCGGLDCDWRGMPFDVSARLLAMADHVEKLTARCAVTGLAAQKTYKKSADATRIALGAADTYEPRSNAAWEGIERSLGEHVRIRHG